MTIEVKLGDIVRLRKVHPCGSYKWEVVTVGGDIGLKCQRMILLASHVFRRRLGESVSESDQQTSFAPQQNTPRWSR
ncbi:MAG: DUF951 domain-containing protein [Dehalococcoidia bacterium]|nr:DUF951 domain-containing protein [Dehalococcoidia bacterium]MDH4300015.1 DUF951 domain-containing protein [Dehalococcoidia bacterium]MDH4367379.1 DUF951 domain-containing protein [Dehalococcoidia bacterium]